MSAPLDPDAQEDTLDLLFGGGTPATWEIALFAGDPTNGGVEMDSVGGYVRAPLPNDGTSFVGASGNQTVSIIVDFDPPSDAWTAGGQPVPATHFLLIDAADSTTRYYPGALGEEISIYGTEPTVQVRLTGYWDTES